MKLVKRIVFVLLFGLLAAVGVIFWPKIRECCDRWLAEEKTGNPTGNDTTTQVENS